MPPVFPEMDGDAIGAAELGQYRCPDGVWLLAASRLTQSGDVVDVDAQTRHDRDPRSRVFDGGFTVDLKGGWGRLHRLQVGLDLPSRRGDEAGQGPERRFVIPPR